MRLACNWYWILAKKVKTILWSDEYNSDESKDEYKKSDTKLGEAKMVSIHKVEFLALNMGSGESWHRS